MSERAASQGATRPDSTNGNGVVQDPRGPTCVADGLYLGGVEETHSASHLRSLGITHIVNAAREDENRHPDQFQYLHIYARDNTAERLTPYFAEVAQWVESAQRSGGKAMIHCRQGVSRSVTLTLATRMVQTQLPLSQLFADLKARRPQIEPNPQFLSELRQLELRLFGQYCQTKLTPLDDMRMPEPDQAAKEQTLRLLAKAAACPQENLQDWPEFTQAHQQLLLQWNVTGVFENCLVSVMELHAGSSKYDDAAQTALRLLLVAVADTVPEGRQSLIDRCEKVFASEEWHDLCIDVPLLPRQAKALMSQLQPIKP